MPWPERHGSLVRSTQVTLGQGTVGWVGDAALGMAIKKRKQPGCPKTPHFAARLDPRRMELRYSPAATR